MKEKYSIIGVKVGVCVHVSYEWVRDYLCLCPYDIRDIIFIGSSVYELSPQII